MQGSLHEATEAVLGEQTSLLIGTPCGVAIADAALKVEQAFLFGAEADGDGQGVQSGCCGMHKAGCGTSPSSRGAWQAAGGGPRTAGPTTAAGVAAGGDSACLQCTGSSGLAQRAQAVPGMAAAGALCFVCEAATYQRQNPGGGRAMCIAAACFGPEVAVLDMQPAMTAPSDRGGDCCTSQELAWGDPQEGAPWEVDADEAAASRTGSGGVRPCSKVGDDVEDPGTPEGDDQMEGVSRAGCRWGKGQEKQLSVFQTGPLPMGSPLQRASGGPASQPMGHHDAGGTCSSSSGGGSHALGHVSDTACTRSDTRGRSSSNSSNASSSGCGDGSGSNGASHGSMAKWGSEHPGNLQGGPAAASRQRLSATREGVATPMHRPVSQVAAGASDTSTASTTAATATTAAATAAGRRDSKGSMPRQSATPGAAGRSSSTANPPHPTASRTAAAAPVGGRRPAAAGKLRPQAPHPAAPKRTVKSSGYGYLQPQVKLGQSKPSPIKVRRWCATVPNIYGTVHCR